MKTYRITLEYTTCEDMSLSPEYWDWHDILNLDWGREAFGVWVEAAPLNEDHVAAILETQRQDAEIDEEIQQALRADVTEI